MMTNFIQFFQTHPVAFYWLIGLLSLMVGSFLNVVIYRLPEMMFADWREQATELLSDDTKANNTSETDAEEKPKFNLFVPRSCCPKCKTPISAIDNVPVLSYVCLLGRCRHCNTSISIRYPFVEFLTALLSVVVAVHYGPTLQALAVIFLTWSLVAMSFIDIDHQILPDNMTLSLLWLGLLCNYYGVFVSLHTAVMGAIVGYLSLWIVMQLFKLVTGKQGMGHGDFKLLGLFGAWIGWQKILLIVILSSFVGAILGIIILKCRDKDKNTPIPFGPFLAVAGWIAILWGTPLIQYYLQFTGIA